MNAIDDDFDYECRPNLDEADVERVIRALGNNDPGEALRVWEGGTESAAERDLCSRMIVRLNQLRRVSA